MMEKIISFANTSASSVYGCIACAIQDRILQEFPKDFFKYMTISSEIATRNIRRNFRTINTNNEMSKREKPYLVIQPTYAVMEEDGPLQNIPLTSNFYNMQFGIDAYQLQPVLHDEANGYNLRYKFNRDRIEYDITVVLGTEIHQIDVYKAFANNISWRKPEYLRIALESIIPKRMIAIISKLCGMDLEQKEEYIPILLRYLNSIPGCPISYKLRNSSASDEWFMHYPHNVVITFDNFEFERGQRKGMTDDYNPFTFKVTAEFNYPAVYYIDAIPEKIKGIDFEIKTKEYDSDNDTFVPIYSIENLMNRYPPIRNGMHLYGTSLIKTDVKDSRQVEYRVPLSSVIDNQHINVIRAHAALNIPVSTLMELIVLKNREEQSYDTEYYVDWNTLELVIKKPDNTATYRIIMYFNYAQVNEVLLNQEYRNYYDTDKLKPNKIEPKKNPEAVEKSSDEESSTAEEEENVEMENPKPGDIDTTRKIISLLNNNASVAEIHNAMQQDKVHETPVPIPMPPEDTVSTGTTTTKKKRFTSTAK